MLTGWLLRDELTVRVISSDLAPHQAWVRWARRRVEAGHLPLDGWFAELSGGSPVFHQYQSAPHALTGALSAVVGGDRLVFVVMWLLLSLWPLCVFASVRILSGRRDVALGAAMVAPLVVSVSNYGYEWSSYLSVGLWAQLWSMWALPLALALGHRAVREGRRYGRAVLAGGATIAFHLLTGYLLVAVWAAMWLVRPSEWRRRLPRVVCLVVGSACVASFALLPAFTDRAFLWARSTEVGSSIGRSYGAARVLGWLVSGQLFDVHRLPVVTLLLAVGLWAAVRRGRHEEWVRLVSVLTIVSLLLFFGRPTWGPLVDAVPLLKDLVLHRFIIGVHLGGIVLAGLGLATLWHALTGLAARRSSLSAAARTVVAAVVVALLLWPAWVDRNAYAAFSRRSLQATLAVEEGPVRDIDALLAVAEPRGRTRCYGGSLFVAGSSPASAVGRYVSGFVGPVRVQSLLLDRNVDSVGMHTRTLALVGDAEVAFDDTSAAHHALWNVGCVIGGRNGAVPPGGRRAADRGDWSLWSVPAPGYLELVDTVGPALVADRATLGRVTAGFLASDGPTRRRYPPVRFPGVPELAATLPTDAAGGGPPGRVLGQSADLDDGRFSATVVADRAAVVRLAAGYHPRLEATVDGRPAPVGMVAPGMAAVAVPEGRHTVTIRYRPVDTYPWWGLLAALALSAAVAAPALSGRLAARRQKAR